MKWIFILFVGVMLWGGFVQHTHNEDGINQSTKELLEENGYGSVGISGINLPISYTLFAQKVDSEVFITQNGKHRSITVTVTPIESFPIVSILSPPSYWISVDRLSNANLADFLKYLFDD